MCYISFHLTANTTSTVVQVISATFYTFIKHMLPQELVSHSHPSTGCLCLETHSYLPTSDCIRPQSSAVITKIIGCGNYLCIDKQILGLLHTVNLSLAEAKYLPRF